MKKKFKLEPHEDQLFLDGNEVSVRGEYARRGDAFVIPKDTKTPQCVSLLQVYVWIYDPVHFKTFAMGLILGESVSENHK